MARHRPLIRPSVSATALLAALLVAVLSGIAFPAAAVAGENGKGHAKQDAKADKGNNGNKADKGDKGDKGDPPGNNGTVKITPSGESDGTPDNNPHPGCTFQVEWYGFDEGPDIKSTVEFAMQAPTSDVGLSWAPEAEVFVGGDPATGAGTETGLDGRQEYTLSFDGEPHPQQGYHVKLTVHTPYSKGSDTKHKVFWVEGCEAAETPEAAPGDSADQPEAAEENDTQVENNDTEVRGEQASVPTDVLGVQASTHGSQAQDSPGTKAAGQAAESAAVPTAVDAGMSGAERLRSILPALAVLLGLGVTGAAIMRRRRTRA